MGVALLIIAVLLLLLLMLLAIPLTVAFRINRIKETSGQVRFRWLFGLVRFRMSIPAGKDVQHKQKPAKKTDKRRPVFALLKQTAFRRRVIRFIRDLLRAAHARGLYLRLRFGLGDPADTGRLWGFLGPVAGIAANLQSAEVRIEPEFMDPVLEVEGRGELRLIPLQFIALAATFMVSPTTLHAWRTLRRSSTNG